MYCKYSKERKKTFRVGIKQMVDIVCQGGYSIEQALDILEFVEYYKGLSKK